jgi:hypothetical protein
MILNADLPFFLDFFEIDFFLVSDVESSSTKSTLELVAKTEATDEDTSSDNSATHKNNDKIVSTKWFLDNNKYYYNYNSSQYYNK